MPGSLSKENKSAPCRPHCMRTLLATGFVLFATTAQAQDAPAPQDHSNSSTNSSTNITNASKNPVTPKTQILAQNYFMPSPQGYGGRQADEEWLRLYSPFIVFGVQSIFRVYHPIDTKPL